VKKEWSRSLNSDSATVEISKNNLGEYAFTTYDNISGECCCMLGIDRKDLTEIRDMIDEILSK